MTGLRIAVLLVFVAVLGAQEVQPPQAAPADPERWNLFWQATSIGQYHGTFPAAYTGPNSLQDYSERDVSLTTTLFFGLRLEDTTYLYFDPEIAGGRGFSGVTGIANFPNGELPRVASATPKPYLARLYVMHDFGFGDATEAVESDENQLAGNRPAIRYTIAAGRFTLTDFFDNNRYSHDPRTQFMGWATMYNGAWDYPADTRGYTWGWVHEFHTPRWSLRYASAAMPKNANGGRFDRRLFRDRGDAVENEFDYAPGGHAGALRLLAFLNHADSGSYVEAVQLSEQTGQAPNLNDARRIGTRKYGFGVNAEQQLTKDAGFFVRLGWNDGKTQDFVFTAMDRVASGGLSVTGTRWNRHEDTVGTALTVGGISGIHALFLARGGLDFIIGDGRLNYAPEYVWESYYSARVFKWLSASFDIQHIQNPAYNQDRGPLWAPSIRLHVETKIHE